MESIGWAVYLLAILGFVCFMVWHGNNEKNEKRRLRLEEQSRILDRLESNQDLAEFLRTDEGKALFGGDDRDVQTERENSMGAGVAGMMIAGIVCLAIGLAFFVLRYVSFEEFIIPAVIVTALGIGLLIAARAQYLLGRRWGIFGPPDGNVATRQTLE